MHRTIDLDRWVTLEAAAARRGVSIATIWRRAALGQLHPRRVLGRTVVDAMEVDSLDLADGGGRHRRTRASTRRTGT